MFVHPVEIRQQALCPRCWRGTRAVRFTPEDDAELLGLYLGCVFVNRTGPSVTLMQEHVGAKS